MTLSPEQQRSFEGLISQVSADNVLAVARVLRTRADDMESMLNASLNGLDLRPCAEDPVSLDARDLFQRKIDHILAGHWAHCAELRAAHTALRATALEYGVTDTDLAREFGDDS
ncbi:MULTISPECIES: hypothetical protein [unclassified Pseudonocardia]|uniref:hypothetical protein n=1 Tax=unclassified Pseudonocardia TaxID=2619320 RepID=UPI001CF6FA44|nr:MULTISPECIES: hypothetical protein [unclassified Pseudonocardia]